jgi:hypothetical protein
MDASGLRVASLVLARAAIEAYALGGLVGERAREAVGADRLAHARCILALIAFEAEG